MTHDAYSTKRVTVWNQEKDGVAGKAVKYQDGYISWCPDTVYARDYQPTDALSFGHAVHALKAGHRVARAGWNGKGMYVFLRKGVFDGPYRGFKVGASISANHPSRQDGVSMSHFFCGEAGSLTEMPCLVMRAASGVQVPGWLASQTDMLADDWTILDEV